MEEAKGSRRLGELLDALPTGRLNRGLKVLGILNESVGVGLVKRQARSLLGRASAHEGGAEALQQELGLAMARSMGEMKGLIMKVGQMLSYLDSELPPQAREVLSQLQTRVAPVDTARMREVFKAEFGLWPEEAFAHFDPVPIAAASVGQVYRATLSDGREVAVKIQYPEIVTAVRNDLQNVSMMSQVATLLNESVTDVIDELRSAIDSELNYLEEAENIRAFAAIYEGDPVVAIPVLVPEWSGRTVLTTLFERGLSFQQMLDTYTAAQRFEVSRALGRFFYVAFYFYGMFNADPHPGNYIFRPDGKVVFLDYGCVRRFDRPFLDNQILFTQALRAGDRRSFAEMLVKMGIVPEENRDRVDWGLLFSVFETIYQPLVRDELFQYTPAYNKRVAELMYELKKTHMLALRLPRQFLFLNRITFGLNAIHARLGLALNYYRPGTALFEFYQGELMGRPVQDPREHRVNYHALEIRYPAPSA